MSGEPHSMVNTNPNTSPTTEQILEKLTDGWFIGDIVKSYALESDADVLDAVAQAEKLPPEHPAAQLLRQYRQNRKSKVWAILCDLKQSLEEIYGERLAQLVLFGSQARGDTNPCSDIDVLIVLKGTFDWLTESKRISQSVADLCLRHTELISCLLMDETTFLHGSEPLLENVRQEGIRV